MILSPSRAKRQPILTVMEASAKREDGERKRSSNLFQLVNRQIEAGVMPIKKPQIG